MNIHFIFARFFPVLYSALRDNHGRHISSTWCEDPGYWKPLEALIAVSHESKRDWERQWWNIEKSMTVLKISLKRLPITFCSPKITRFSLQRFHSQKALGLHKGSDAVFQPSIGILARADREFEFLGPRTTLQGSAKKLDDAPKLKLPEVSCYLSYC